MTARVVGIGGIFFKARDPEALRAWYRDHLGLAIAEWGGVAFEPTMASPAGRPSTLVWSILPAESQYLDPSASLFMINYRVDDLDQVLAALRAEGCAVDERVESSSTAGSAGLRIPRAIASSSGSHLRQPVLERRAGRGLTRACGRPPTRGCRPGRHAPREPLKSVDW
jgi:catechol 2,3-dioxygenase-like lactoylglutathione lyase family enzyme